MGVLRYVCPYFCFFRALFDEISKVSILGELYIISNWLAFQNG